MTEKAFTELQQGRLGPLRGWVRSSLPRTPLVLCSPGEEKVQPSPGTPVLHPVPGGGVGTRGAIDSSC